MWENRGWGEKSEICDLKQLYRVRQELRVWGLPVLNGRALLRVIHKTENAEHESTRIGTNRHESDFVFIGEDSCDSCKFVFSLRRARGGALRILAFTRARIFGNGEPVGPKEGRGNTGAWPLRLCRLVGLRGV